MLNTTVVSLDSLNPTVVFTGWGAFSVFLGLRPSRREVAAAAALGVLAGCLFLLGRESFGSYWGSYLFGWGTFLGEGAVFVSAFRVLRGRTREQRRTLLVQLLQVAAFLLVTPVVWYFVPFVERITKVSYDAQLYAVEHACAFNASFVLGRGLQASPARWALTTTVYYALPFIIALACASRVFRNDTPGRVFGLMVSGSIIGFLLYTLVPAAGPAYAFPSFYPYHLPTPAMQNIELPLGSRFNCVPSLHLAFAVLALWNTRRAGLWLRMFLFAFAIGTAYATLATGEHYLVDLVVAFPFCVFMQGVWAPGKRGLRASFAAMAALLFTVWVLLLRNTELLVAAPNATRAGALLTVALSLAAERVLSREGQPRGHPILEPELLDVRA